MKRNIWILFVFLFTMIAASAPNAGDFDGTKPLLISIIRVIECTPDGVCNEVTPASAELPQFMKIDFTNKTISPATGDGTSPNQTSIERQELVDGKLILQGAEDGYDKMRDGLGWTMAISEESGQVVLTASGDQVAFVIFGASLPM